MNALKDAALALVAESEPHTVVLDLGVNTDLDIQAADAIGELADELRRHDIEVRLAEVRAARALQVLAAASTRASASTERRVADRRDA